MKVVFLWNIQFTLKFKRAETFDIEFPEHTKEDFIKEEETEI